MESNNNLEKKLTEGESGDNSIQDDIHNLFETMYGVTSIDPIENVKLGPVSTSTVDLLDTG